MGMCTVKVVVVYGVLSVIKGQSFMQAVENSMQSVENFMQSSENFVPETLNVTLGMTTIAEN